MLVGHLLWYKLLHEIERRGKKAYGLTSLLFGSLFCTGSASVLFALHAMSSSGIRLSSTRIMTMGLSTAW